MTTRFGKSRNPERTEFSVRLWYPDPVGRLRLVRLPEECLRQFVEPSLFSVRSDVRLEKPSVFIAVAGVAGHPPFAPRRPAGI
jgi:hypothetical protein